jgi:hypothetical protein
MEARSIPESSEQLALRFIDCINRGDVAGLGRLMTEDHELRVFDESPLTGREANVAAWRGYVDSFPTYCIFPRRVSERDGIVAILGHTTGSHLGLPDAEEQQLTLIWVAEIVDGGVRSWRLIADSSENRERFGLTGEA